jgi:hypothetical protein
MKIVAVASLLAMLGVVPCRAQQNTDSLPALFPLFVSCDLVSQFVTPGFDEDMLIRLESPVSREGARMLEESRKRCVVARIPLLLEKDAAASSIESAPVARLETPSRDRAGVHLIAANYQDIDTSAGAALPARTGPSTWVRIRALFGR